MNTLLLQVEQSESEKYKKIIKKRVLGGESS